MKFKNEWILPLSRVCTVLCLFKHKDNFLTEV